MTTTRKTYFRNDQARYNYIHNLKASIRRIYREAKKNGTPHSEILDATNKLFKGNRVTTAPGQWEKLTACDQSEIFGYCRALSDELMDGLAFMYLIRDKWYTPQEVIDGKDGTSTSNDIPAGGSNGHYVYTFTENGNTVYKPF
jgi:hypothetical protein